MYQVGDARNPDADDVQFDTQAEAVAHAVCAGGNIVWGVWRWDDGGNVPELLMLVFERKVYLP